MEPQIAARDRGVRVLCPGFLENPFPLIAGADCYIPPSNAEGFPNGLVEAMALGLPVISTDCPSGPSEILAERQRGGLASLDCASHGLLAPSNDRAALAEGLRRYQDPPPPIGRASCRERVGLYVSNLEVAGSLKKNKQYII